MNPKLQITVRERATKICSIFNEVLPVVTHNDQIDKIRKIYIILIKAKDLWKVTRGACHPNLQVANFHLGFSDKNEWNAGDTRN